MRWTLLAALCAGALTGCGGSSSSSSSTPPSLPTFYATVATPAGTQIGSVTINYSIVDPQSDLCVIAVEFSTDGGTSWGAATAAPGGEGTAALASSPAPGTSHGFLWNSLIDGVGTGAADPDVRIRIIPSAATPGAAGMTANFTVDNSANTPPSLGLASPGATQSGLVSLSYALTDAESNLCRVTAEFSVDGGTTWARAFVGPGGDGTTNLASSPGAGTSHAFVWNSFADGVALGGSDFFVQVRMTPSDGVTGAAVAQTFTVDNSGVASGAMVSSSFPIQSSSANFLDTLATDGRYMYLFGSQGGGAGSDTSWRIEKRNLYDGTLAPLFGAGGVLVVNPGPGRDEAENITIVGSSIYLCGLEEDALGSGNDRVRIEKRAADTGALDTSFGTGGVLTLAYSGGIPLVGMAIGSSYMYLALGELVMAPDDYQMRIEKRTLTDGSLVAGFGTGGAVTENPTAESDFFGGIAVSGGYLYVAGIVRFQSDMTTRVEKRSASDGSLVTSVDVNDSVGGQELTAGLVIDASSMYLFEMVETSPGSSTFEWRVAKRSLSDLSLVTSVTSAGLSGDFTKGSVVVNGGSLYVTGMDGAGGWGSDTRWRIEKRRTSDLGLVSSFGTSGVVLSDPTTGEDVSRSLAVDGGVVYIVGFEDVPMGPQEWRVEARFE